MNALWPFIYSVSFGLVGVYYAKRTKKNSYLWFFLGSLFTIYIPFVILSLMLIKALLKYYVVKKLKTSFQTSTRYQSPSPAPAPAKPITSEKAPLFWYYLTENKETKGPVSSLGLQQLQKESVITDKTLVWNETFENWTPFREAFSSQEG
jgi:hypothetical protein